MPHQKAQRWFDQHPNRLGRKNQEEATDLVSFSFNGHPVVGRKGESIAASLIAAGIRNFRQDRGGKNRGIYCGMGTCFECLVQINGSPSQRACLIPVENGMDIQTQTYAPSVGSRNDQMRPSFHPTSPSPRRTALLIIGAGPGGLASAIAAARCGVNVTVLDERTLPGGQYFKQPATAAESSDKSAFDQQSLQGRSLIETARNLGVEILSKTTVWNAVESSDGFDLHVFQDGDPCCFTANQLIIATGAYEKSFPVPGWTLPGFLTTGAVQTLIRAYKVAPGSRILISGNGPLNLQVAAELIRNGVSVAAVIETSRPNNLRNFRALTNAVCKSPALILKGVSYLRTLKKANVPVFYNHVLIRAEGVDNVECGYVAALDNNGRPIPGSERKFEVDTICVGYGFIPNTELTRLLGCSHNYDRDSGALIVSRNDDGSTSRAGVFSVGDAGELQGAQVALAQGMLAGFSAAQNLGRTPSNVAEVAKAKRRLIRHREFQQALWTLFGNSKVDWVSHSSDSVTICRCEDITVGQISRVIQNGVDDIGSLKKLTRVGMGRCQGRYCGPLVVKMLAERTKREPDRWSWFAPRFPVKPLPIGRAARMTKEWDIATEGFEASRLAQTFTESSGNLARHESQVIIIGAGILGSCTAYFLARSGIDVVLLDRGEPNGEASGNNAGSLHVQLLAYDFVSDSYNEISPAGQTLPLQQESTLLWNDLAKEFGQDLEIIISGGLMVAEDETRIRHLEKKVEVERKLGIDVELISGVELRNLAPAVSERMVGASWCPEEGKINPMTAAFAVLDAALAAGTRLYKHTNVLDINKRSRCFEVTTSAGLFKAPQIVNAAGGWSALIASMVGISLPIRAHPIQMIVTEPISSMVDQLLAYADRHLTLKQVQNGNLIIGGGWKAGVDPVTSRPVVLQESFEGNLWVAQQVIPALEDIHVIRSWAAMNVNIDGAPILGESQKVPGFYHAVSVNGITLGPLIGHMTAETVRTRSAVPGISGFTLDRFN